MKTTSDNVRAVKMTKNLGNTGIKAGYTVFFDTMIKTGDGKLCAVKYRNVLSLMVVKEQKTGYLLTSWDEQGAPVDFMADKTELEIIGRVIQANPPMIYPPFPM